MLLKVTHPPHSSLRWYWSQQINILQNAWPYRALTEVNSTHYYSKPLVTSGTVYVSQRAAQLLRHLPWAEATALKTFKRTLLWQAFCCVWAASTPQRTDQANVRAQQAYIALQGRFHAVWFIASFTRSSVDRKTAERQQRHGIINEQLPSDGMTFHPRSSWCRLHCRQRVMIL